MGQNYLRCQRNRWVKSSFSYASGDCVKVAAMPDGQVGIRDSKDAADPLRFTQAEWKAFADGLRGGEFDKIWARISAR
jgi:hypothetical protein